MLQYFTQMPPTPTVHCIILQYTYQPIADTTAKYNVFIVKPTHWIAFSWQATIVLSDNWSVTPCITALYLVYIFILELKQACSPSVSFASCRTSFTMILFLSVTRTSKFLHCDHLCKQKGMWRVTATFIPYSFFPQKVGKETLKTPTLQILLGRLSLQLLVFFHRAENRVFGMPHNRTFYF